MKKKQILFTIIGILAAIIVVRVALNFPPSSKEDLSGTIGKVDKYRKVQLTEKDVILRKEFISDTSKLAKSIRGLVYYNAFAKSYASDLKVFSDYLKKNNPGIRYVKELEDYINFINNNSSSIENTIGLLFDIYSNDTTSYSANAESKLKTFDSFVYEMMRRDSVITMLIPGLENEIGKVQKTSGNKNEELKVLKNIHDQMILKNFQLGCLMGSDRIFKSFLNQSFYDLHNLGVLGNGKLDINGYSNATLELIKSHDNLGIFNKSAINLYLGSGGNGGYGVGVPAAKVFDSQHTLNLVANKSLNSSQSYGGAFMNQGLGIASYNQQLGEYYCSNVHNFGSYIFGSILCDNASQFQSHLLSFMNTDHIGVIELGHIILNQDLGSHSSGLNVIN